ncbi:MAG: ion channel [Cytophagales bacterium]|nr:ion channel [Cytophagales bacterium]
MPTLTIPPQWRILVVMAAVFGTHIVCIWLYAVVYYLLIHHWPLGSFVGESINQGINDPASFLSCLFFSSSTYASLGLGDMFPSGGLRMLAGVQVLNGLVLIGWTIS